MKKIKDRSINLTDDKKNLDCLLSNNKIIRNKKKIIAIIYNSKIFIDIIKDNGSFKNWMDKNKKISNRY